MKWKFRLSDNTERIELIELEYQRKNLKTKTKNKNKKRETAETKCLD